MVSRIAASLVNTRHALLGGAPLALRRSSARPVGRGTSASVGMCVGVVSGFGHGIRVASAPRGMTLARSPTVSRSLARDRSAGQRFSLIFAFLPRSSRR